MTSEIGNRILSHDILQAFVAPKRVFERLVVAESPKWGVAYLVPLLCGLAINLINRNTTAQLIASAVAQMPASTGLTESIMRTTVVVNMVIGLVIVPLTGALWVALVASVYSLLTSQLVPLNRLYALAVWAALPQTIFNYALSGVTARWLSIEQIQSLKGPLTSLVFLRVVLPDWGVSVARAIDLPYIWFLMLLAIGYAVVVQRPVRKVLVLPLMLFGLHVLFAVLLD